MNRVAIVIVSYNCDYLQQKNIESIRNTLEKDTYSIYVVDNASTDGVLDYLRAQDDIHLIENKENLGFAKACNIGVKATIGTVDENSDVFLLNNDTRLCEKSLENLKRALYSADDIGAVGSISNYSGNDQRIELNLSVPSDYVEYGNNINSEELEFPYEERVRLCGFAMLIRRNVWNEIGGLDEAFSPGYYEDDDFSMKVLKLGYRMLVVNNSFIYHAGSQSFSKRPEVAQIELDHCRLFISKHGFNIFDYYQPERNYAMSIPYEKDDEFNVLEIGCGLGADLKLIRSRFKNANCYGIEKDLNLYEVVKHTEKVCTGTMELANLVNPAFFDVVIGSADTFATMPQDEWDVLVELCKPECAVFSAEGGDLSEFPFNEIKLIIWDMDETYWKGTISEGFAKLPDGNVEMVKNLTDAGIINSISSKNDEIDVEKILNAKGIWDYFVFNNINWNNKGSQIKQKISDMNLRPENVLFIDDNPRNLEEANFKVPGIMVSDPEIIPYLADYAANIEKNDLNHERLNHYKLLESKKKAKNLTDDDETFLRESDICVSLIKANAENLDRICELVERTNQLNYTKVRSSKSDIWELINNPDKECRIISVKDKFGDYGLSGFYCLDLPSNRLEHFLFSCRIMGMKVEQYIYDMLGNVEINVAEPVAVKLLPDNQNIDFIHEGETILSNKESESDGRVRVLVKGPCDLKAVCAYLNGGNITEEFHYVNDEGYITAGQNHSVHIKQSATLSKDEINEIIKDAPFITEGDFSTSIFDKEYDVICYSLLTDAHAGLYKNKKTGNYITFSSRNFDLTNLDNSDKFIDATYANHAYPFTKEIIEDFSKKWEFLGETPIPMIIENLEYICNNVKGSPRIILLLGSETEYENEGEEFAGHAIRHAQVNSAIAEFAKGKSQISLINATEFIRGQKDFIDCINHFSRNVYYEIATRIVALINSKGSEIESIQNRFDTLIMTTPDDFLRTRLHLPRLEANLPGRRIIFVGSKKVGELLKEYSDGDRFDFICEDDIISFNEVHKMMSDHMKDLMAPGEELSRKITGWYYQQFLKMEYAYKSADEYYMTWDGDTIPTKTFNMFNNEEHPYFDMKYEEHPEYFITMGVLIPGLRKFIGKSFISEHMIFNCDIMKALIDKIENNNSITGNRFYEKIINAIEPERIMKSAFSEFETYGNFLCIFDPYKYKLREWHSFRLAGQFFDPETITDGDYEWLSKDFEAISFEKGHTVRYDHKNLFTNPQYQKKLTARQMLEIAQEEFSEGYKEVWGNSQSTYKDKDKYDVLILTTPSDYDRVRLHLNKMERYLPGRRIIFIGSSEVGEKIKQDGPFLRVTFVNENDILKFDDVYSFMSDTFSERVSKGECFPRKVCGWYYQQFLKMAYAKFCEDEYYMTWDGDTVPVVAFSMFDDEGHPYFDMKSEYREDYFTTLAKIIPGVEKFADDSFISEHMLFDKNDMQGLIERIEDNEAIPGKLFYEKILNSINPDRIAKPCFSEFETYGNYMYLNRPEKYILRKWNSFRLGSVYFDPNQMSERDYDWLAKDFYAISFEKNQELSKEFSEIFMSESYQEKMSVSQLLEITQQAFEGGYKEVF